MLVNNMQDRTKNKCMQVHKREGRGRQREGDQQASSLMTEHSRKSNHKAENINSVTLCL